MSRPRTPTDIADALHTIADQIAAMPNPDQPIGGEFGTSVTISIQPRTAADVDQFSRALYDGTVGTPQHMPSGTWHHSSPRNHTSHIDVQVFCAVEDPRLAALLAEVALLRTASEVPAEFVAAGRAVRDVS